MKAVLLAFHYPPDSAVGSLRPIKVAHSLRDAGWEVTVITATLENEKAGVRAEEAGLNVIAVKPHKNPREWYASFKRLRRGAVHNGETEAQAGSSYIIPARVPLWKRAIFSLMLLPDHHQGFIRPAIRASLPLLRQPGSILYTTAPPFSVHLAGWMLWRKTKVPWIAEFRDPWTDNPWKPWHVRTALTDSVERWMERAVLRNANLVVAVSEGIERGFANKIVDRENKLVTIRNGIDTLLPAIPERLQDGSPFRIVHIGSFYNGRDPRAFLSALATVRERMGESTRSFRVDLVGNCRWYSGISIEKEVETLNLGDVVHFHDWVSHDRAQQFIRSSDLLLLLAQSQPDQIPNKLYEYLGTRCSILAVADRGGETARMINQVGGHYLVTGTDSREIERALESAIERVAQPNGAQAEEILRDWTTKSQMRRLVRKIEGLG
ncbi:MAG: glycosyltransferase family 4 protein [Gemmatimonadota bacterium]